MKQYLVLLLLIMAGCSSDDVIDPVVEDQSKNTTNLSVNGKAITDNIVKTSAFYSCEETVSVSVRSKKENVTSSLLEIALLKTGELKYLKFTDKKENLQIDYQVADFIPGSTIMIEDFEFIEGEKLRLKFSGDLLKRTNNYFSTPETIDIDGSITIENFSKSICNVYRDFINLNDDITFLDIIKRSQGANSDRSVNYVSTSLDGYQILFNNFDQGLRDMPLGTYNFTDLSTTEKIELSKYIGSARVFSTSLLVPEDWKTFDCNGSFTIADKSYVDGSLVTTVLMNFTASFNGIVEYDFNNAVFKTAL